jgi:hypothetical protein
LKIGKNEKRRERQLGIIIRSYCDMVFRAYYSSIRKPGEPMIYIIFILNCFVFFAALNSGFEYLEYIARKEREEEEKKKQETDERALKIACRKYSKFLNPDGSVNAIAAREYLARRERENRKNTQTINFEVIE